MAGVCSSSDTGDLSRHFARPEADKATKAAGDLTKGTDGHQMDPLAVEEEKRIDAQEVRGDERSCCSYVEQDPLISHK